MCSLNSTHFFSPISPPPLSTLFPYTTLFRSDIIVSLPDGYDLFEIKTARAPRDCVREAFGQLLEYASSWPNASRSEEHTSELQSHSDIVCRLLLEKKK